MFLLFVAVLIFIPLTEGQGRTHPDCCDKGTDKVYGEIVKIFEQKPGPVCAKHFYIVEVEDGKYFCINPDSKWLKRKRDMENFSCPPVGGKVKKRVPVTVF